MWTQPNTLYRYCSPSNPEFTFYYIPLPKYQQKSYRCNYSDRMSTYSFMADLLSGQLVLVEENIGTRTYTYEWPEDVDLQDHLLKRFGKQLVFELGAVTLGWMRAHNEDPEKFMDRVSDTLRDALR